ncbi:MAG: hypothetical protein IKR15_05610 [Bacteroidales bacterium]|nr:hypothetical protein [Bacteroidales bacterium]
MKKFLAIASVLLLAACAKSYPVATGLTATGSCDGTTFTSDEGLVFRIVEDKSTEPMGALERVYITYDVVSRIGNEYEIRLLSWTKPLVKGWIKKADITDEDAIGHDPIRITYGWTGGGYLNLNLDLSFKKESTTKHVVNLVLANPPVQEDTLRLAIRHNGASEALTTDILNQDTDGQWNKTYAFGSSLVCFPTEGLLPEGTDQIPFAITGEWYSQNAETREWTLKESRVTGLLKR